MLALVAVGGAGASLGAAGVGPAPAVSALAASGEVVDLTGDGEVGDDRDLEASSRSAERSAGPGGEQGQQDAAAAVTAAQEQASEQAEAAERLALADQVRTQVAEQHRVQAEAAAAAEAEAALQAALADPRAVARDLAAGYGWGGEQFGCLDSLWTKESGWKHTADNPTSSAYGIPQSLPGEKMASAGADWETNPATQIAWGLGYIDEVYGTPCAAWAKSRAVNWY